MTPVSEVTKLLEDTEIVVKSIMPAIAVTPLMLPASTPVLSLVV